MYICARIQYACDTLVSHSHILTCTQHRRTYDGNYLKCNILTCMRRSMWGSVFCARGSGFESSLHLIGLCSEPMIGLLRVVCLCVRVCLTCTSVFGGLVGLSISRSGTSSIATEPIRIYTYPHIYSVKIQRARVLMQLLIRLICWEQNALAWIMSHDRYVVCMWFVDN